MKKILYIISFTALVLSSACKKIEGPGGTSAIRGQVIGSTSKAGESEITQVICTAGIELEHGDYWLLNTSDPNKLYYVYYDNPTWISISDPQLQGRIGIMVSFNYSDSNIEIAEKTRLALLAISGANYNITLSSDILTITDLGQVNVPDADNGTTNFAVDIANNGKPGSASSNTPIANERVYIIYGQNAFAAKDVRTNEAGAFSFEGLQKGEYTLYVLSKDPVNNGVMTRESIQASITEDNSIVEVETMNIIY
jgi:hypothetical protein